MTAASFGNDLGVRRGVRSVSRFNSRKQRLSLVDPAFPLSRTHTFDHDEAAIDTDAAFPDRDKVITFAMAIKRSGASSNGVLFTLGGSTRGVAAAIDGTGLIFAAGAVAASDDGVDITAANVFLGTGIPYRLVFSVHPNKGRVNLWVNGGSHTFGTSVNGTFNGDWGGTSNGAVGQVGAGGIIDRIPAGQRVTLADTLIVTPLSVYQNQLPRQFNAG